LSEADFETFAARLLPGQRGELQIRMRRGICSARLSCWT
jgi:hypothetical protein